MSREQLEKIVDELVEQLTAGNSPDLDQLGVGLDQEERAELRACAEAACWLESAVVEHSQKSMSASGIVFSEDETVAASADAVSRVATSFAAGQQLGDFEIVQEIGRGGMGIVFEARDKVLERRVALKVLPPGIGWNKTALERFQREARAAGRLQHSNIIPVYQIQEDRGVHFFAMQHVDGFPLSRLARTPHAPTQLHAVPDVAAAAAAETWPEATPEPDDPAYYRFVARVMLRAAQAIEYAHQQGILHRDVKPSNLLVDESNDVWIADFGLARLSTDASVTMSGQLLGTLNYMSPEQAAGGKGVDARSDVYGLGATLYELLTLCSPFVSSSTPELLNAIRDREPTSPRKINPRAPRDLEVIALKAMEKESGRRYASAGAMARDLELYLQDMPIKARRASVVRRGRKWVRRQRALQPLAGQVLVIPVRGTFQRPRIDHRVVADLSARMLQSTAERVLGDELNRQLEKLFRRK